MDSPQKEIFQHQLDNTRLRHANLKSLEIHINMYLTCLEAGYYGDLVNEELDLCNDLRNLTKSVRKCMQYYYKTESEYYDY